MYRIILCIWLSCISCTCLAQKVVKAKYSGGHGCVDKSLTLYTDLTYEYEERASSPFPTKSKRKGSYSINDSSIILYRKKSHPGTFRIINNDILMYSEKEAASKDSSFIKAYNTMRLVSSVFTK